MTITQRPAVDDCPAAPAKYVKLVPEGDLIAVFREQGEATKTLLAGLSEAQAASRYAEGKWSIKQVIGHCTDNERVWMYRLLRIARNDPQALPGYDEKLVAAHAPHDGLTLAELIEEYDAVRAASLTLLKHLPEEAWQRSGEFAGGRLTALAAACVSIGHEIHHVNIIKQRYLG